MRIALCQLDVAVGDLEGNADKVIAQLARAEAAGACLAVFPELVLTGYPPEDLLLEPGLSRATSRAREGRGRDPSIARLSSASWRRTAISTMRPPCVPRARCARSSASSCSPTTGSSTNGAIFRPGANRDRLFLIGGVRVGVTVCEDAWKPLGACRSAGRGGRGARRDDQCVAVTVPASLPTGGGCSPRARPMHPARSPMSTLSAARTSSSSTAPPWSSTTDGDLVGVGSAVREALVILRPGRSIRCSASGSWTAGTRHVGAAAGDDLGGRRRFGRRPGRTREQQFSPLTPIAPRLDRVAEVYERSCSGPPTTSQERFTEVLVALSAASTPRSWPRSQPTLSDLSGCTAC